jgi:hypothetical protein
MLLLDKYMALFPKTMKLYGAIESEIASASLWSFQISTQGVPLLVTHWQCSYLWALNCEIILTSLLTNHICIYFQHEYSEICNWLHSVVYAPNHCSSIIKMASMKMNKKHR